MQKCNLISTKCKLQPNDGNAIKRYLVMKHNINKINFWGRFYCLYLIGAAEQWQESVERRGGLICSKEPWVIIKPRPHMRLTLCQKSYQVNPKINWPWWCYRLRENKGIITVTKFNANGHINVCIKLFFWDILLRNTNVNLIMAGGKVMGECSRIRHRGTWMLVQSFFIICPVQ